MSMDRLVGLRDQVNAALNAKAFVGGFFPE
jgi:hypothetical protein